jgi:hypothetical protein
MLTPDCVTLLHRLQAYLRAEPRRFFMEDWLQRLQPGQPTFRPRWSGHELPAPPCGTAGCLAGSLLLMTGHVASRPLSQADQGSIFQGFAELREQGGVVVAQDHSGVPWPLTKAKELLGLDLGQALKLFILWDPDDPGNLECWPRDLTKQYEEAETPVERVEVACRRVDLFLETGGEK